MDSATSQSSSTAPDVAMQALCAPAFVVPLWVAAAAIVAKLGFASTARLFVNRPIALILSGLAVLSPICLLVAIIIAARNRRTVTKRSWIIIWLAVMSVLVTWAALSHFAPGR